MPSRFSIYKTACWLVDRGYSVIPVRKTNKRALIRWKEYQKRLPTFDELKEWWNKYPDANVALVTGKISGVIVVDIDTKEGYENLNEYLPESVVTPVSRTPSGGWHFFFRYVEGLRNKARVISGTDIRTDGGYAIIPPSMNGNKKSYSWLKGLRISDVDLAEIPELLLDILLQGCGDSSFFQGKKATSFDGKNTNSFISFNNTSTSILGDRPTNHQQQPTNTNIFLKGGTRDEGIFHVANCLIKGGMNRANAQKCLEILASHCDPPFKKSEVSIKIKSALDRAKKRDIGLTQEIREWVYQHPGNFSTTFLYNSLNLTTSTNKNKACVVLGRLCEEGIIERYGKRRGDYRLVERNIDLLDLTAAESEEVDIWLPLYLNKMARIFPGNIIVIAGAPNAGKTAFLLSCCRYNMKKYRVRYLSSEMGIEEAANRINDFDDITLKDWQKYWEFAERYDDFHDVLLKGKGNINIIDYLEQPEGEAYKASHQLTQIHRNLDGAIALVALQKNRGKGRETGVGGDQTLAKPRLYLAMDYGWMKIIKCKSFRKDIGNPNWKECTFSLGMGHHFSIKDDWKRKE